MTTAATTPPPVILTSRLEIRPFTHEDAPFILELLNDKDFIRHIQDRGVRTLEDARGYLSNGPLASYERFGIGLCCVIEQSTGQKVGMCGILQRETLPVPDIGYAFLPIARGKGYAYESSRAVIDFARSKLKLPRILAVTSETNTASQNLLSKLGFRFLNRSQFEPDSEPVPCFELDLAGSASRSA